MKRVTIEVCDSANIVVGKKLEIGEVHRQPELIGTVVKVESIEEGEKVTGYATKVRRDLDALEVRVRNLECYNPTPDYRAATGRGQDPPAPEALKSCPMCGGQPRLVAPENPADGYRVVCTSCFLSTDRWPIGPHWPVEWWNRRAGGE